VTTGSASLAKPLRGLFYAGVIGIALFEVAKVYFIMPMPGSQRLNSLDGAYLLHEWRWLPGIGMMKYTFATSKSAMPMTPA
jgi:hypothetical protein